MIKRILDPYSMLRGKLGKNFEKVQIPGLGADAKEKLHSVLGWSTYTILEIGAGVTAWVLQHPLLLLQ
jgi:hypothetical protein